MNRLLELLGDTQSPAGRATTSVVIVVVAVVVGWAASRILGRRAEDVFTRYYLRKSARYAAAALALIALAVVWRPFAGRIGVVLGLTAAGVAFAMQEVIGAIAGWFNVLWGRIYRVGDRVEVGGVRGDVIDITPLRTKILEIGSAVEEDSWVRGRQLTGRVVAVSNKATFTQPVFNYSAAFDHVWEELSIPVSYDSDWHEAERILQEEAVRASATAGAREAISQFSRRYPVPRTELEPRVFVRATDNWMEIAARFVVPVRTARSVKDEVTRRVQRRFEAAGIDIGSETADLNVRFPGRTAPAPPAKGDEAGGPRTGRRGD
jgi:small-conductance mechanosensitive channel